MNSCKAFLRFFLPWPGEAFETVSELASLSKLRTRSIKFSRTSNSLGWLGGD